MAALGTGPYKHGFKPRHSTTSALLAIFARVVTGFNQRKPPSRTIATKVDISKALSTVSHRLFIEMIHIPLPLLLRNLVRWLVTYLRGRKVANIYQRHQCAITPKIVPSELWGPLTLWGLFDRNLGMDEIIKAMVRPILNYAEPICFAQPKVSFYRLDKLEVIHL